MTAVSLATLSQCTEQEVFDHVVRGLKSQGFERSMNTSAHSLCAYRGDDGRKCAAGWIMTDEEYDPKFDDVDVDGAASWGALVDDYGLPTAHCAFVSELQRLHDRGSSPEHMRLALIDFGQTAGLATTAVLD